MKGHAPSVASEQARAFVALVNFGNYRTAADSLHLTREGLRRRLLVLEDRLRVRLYEKDRGRHTNIRLTREGNLFYTKSVQFLEEAKTLTELFDYEQSSRDIKIAISNYVADHHLSSILRDFHRQLPDVAIQVTAGTEQQVVSTMQQDSRVKLGICVCDNFPGDLIRRQLFSMSWCFVAQLEHPLLQRPNVTLAQLADEPLIMSQHGCPARQRILEAFHQKSITPNVAIEVTTTQMVLNLVEAGIGTAIIPISRPCAIFRGRRVSQVPIMDAIQPIEFAILAQKDLLDDTVASKLLDCIFDQFGHKRLAKKAILGHGSHSSPDKCLLARSA
ncbi:MAG: LysR family transcriptional regulator [Xanthomonadaceae bacterium]|nr:LysR family transcriptional regulator [Xanthomonadaceae bacterium]